MAIRIKTFTQGSNGALEFVVHEWLDENKINRAQLIKIYSSVAHKNENSLEYYCFIAYETNI
jgi:hypothetical protein